MGTYRFNTISSPSTSFTTVTGENNFGQLIGYYFLSGNEHDFVGASGSFSDLPYPANTYEIRPYGINGAGTVVGKYETYDGVTHGFIYSPASGYSIINYASVGSTEFAGISGGGLIAGTYTNDQSQHIFTYNSATGVFTTLNNPNLGTIEIIAHGINASGQIVGEYYDGSYHGFVYTNGTYVTLDDPNASVANGGTQASAINSAGQVVGDYFDANGGIHGFLWSNGLYQTIDDPVAVLSNGGTVPTGINDKGDIVGYFSDGAGRHGFIASTSPVAGNASHMSISDAPLVREIAQGAQAAVFTVSLDAASQDTISVNFSTQDGTAHAGADYKATVGTVMFAPGQTTATISVPLINHLLATSNLSFSVALSNPTDITDGSTPTIARALGIGTIAPGQYKLHFTFTQSADSHGAIQLGQLSAGLYENGKLIYTQSAQAASCDDAFPLINGASVSLDAPPTKVSASLGLVYLVNSLRAGSNQSGVEIHVGSPGAKLGGQYSYDSQSCLTVSRTNFLNPLETELTSIARALNPTSTSAVDLSAWINADVQCDIDSTVTGLTQAQMNVRSTVGNAFVVDITRAIEKDVKVLYRVSDGTNETIREVIIGAGSSSKTISVSQLFTDLSTTSSIDPYLSFSNATKQAEYVAHYNKALTAPTGTGVSYTATILGYEVNYHNQTNGARFWYFDGKPNETTTTIDNERLMFGSTETATLQYGQSKLVAQAVSTVNPADYSLAIADTSSHVIGSLSQLISVQSAVSSIVLTDGATPSLLLSSAQFQADHALIDKIVSPFNLQINFGSGVTSIDAPTNGAVNLVGGQHNIVGDGHHNEVVFATSFADFTVQRTSGSVLVAEAPGAASLNLNNVEFLTFADKTIFVEGVDNANIARLYSAALGRAPDIGGESGWEDIYSNNISAIAKAGGVYLALAQTPIAGASISIAQGFTLSTEFQQRYGALDDAGFVSLLYQNVLNRAPSAGERDAWVSNIHAGESREMVLVGFAESAENIAKTAADWLIQI